MVAHDHKMRLRFIFVSKLLWTLFLHAPLEIFPNSSDDDV